MPDLRNLPSVDKILQMPEIQLLDENYGRRLVTNAIRGQLDKLRHSDLDALSLISVALILEGVQNQLKEWTDPTLLPVINATGVILHTNLGRAPLSRAALQAINDISRGYSSLEFDLTSGGRGSRYLHAESLLTRLSGAEDAMVVNNNAAGVLLALSALANRRKVITAASQLVEIGGGFRIPDVLKQSGAHLVCVGTTNQVHLSDYEEALGEPAAAVLRVHSSNYKIIGFASEPSLTDICAVSHSYGIPVIDDLGSGTFIDTETYHLAHEPMVQESVRNGADLICFSGDKLLGGPQAGIIIGRKDLIHRLKKHPLARAVRADKLCLAALSATLLHYLKEEAEQEIPVWRMISEKPDELRTRAERWRQEINQGEVIPGESTVGGGSLPGETLPTFLLALQTRKPEMLLKQLRSLQRPIIARILEDHVVLDPRTVLSEEDSTLLLELHMLLKSG